MNASDRGAESIDFIGLHSGSLSIIRDKQPKKVCQECSHILVPSLTNLGLEFHFHGGHIMISFQVIM